MYNTLLRACVSLASAYVYVYVRTCVRLCGDISNEQSGGDDRHVEEGCSVCAHSVVERVMTRGYDATP